MPLFREDLTQQGQRVRTNRSGMPGPCHAIYHSIRCEPSACASEPFPTWTYAIVASWRILGHPSLHGTAFPKPSPCQPPPLASPHPTRSLLIILPLGFVITKPIWPGAHTLGDPCPSFRSCFNSWTEVWDPHSSSYCKSQGRSLLILCIPSHPSPLI